MDGMFHVKHSATRRSSPTTVLRRVSGMLLLEACLACEGPGACLSLVDPWDVEGQGAWTWRGPTWVTASRPLSAHEQAQLMAALGDRRRVVGPVMSGFCSVPCLLRWCQDLRYPGTVDELYQRWTRPALGLSARGPR